MTTGPASVARDMIAASLAVILIAMGILGWSYFRLDAQQPRALPIAETGMPATLAATGTSRPVIAAASTRRAVLIRLASYQPPTRGTVQVVVKAVRQSADPVELGRFAVFPNTAFGPDSEASQRTYQVPARACPSEPGLPCTLDLEVSLNPVAGTGEGARLSIAGATIEWR